MRKTLLLILCITAVYGVTACKKTAAPHIPILGWYSIPPGEYATLEHYREMREAGFDYSFSHIFNIEDAIRALDLCAQTGMKSVFMCPELKTQPEETVRRVMNHPGLGMYFLRDEPQVDEMEALGAWARRIESVDRKHPCYLNLLPGYGPEYEASLRAFSEKVALPQISFDHYPITVVDGIESVAPTWYLNLELLYAEARRSGKPLWAFALATSHMSFPVPTMGHLRLQVYSNLAYGAQLLQYFTYWKPGTEIWDFHDAPMTQGRRSPVYELVREMNREIQQRAFVWDGCCVENISHVADTLPAGTRPLSQLPAHFLTLRNERGHGLVSEIRNGNRRFVMLVNTASSKDWRVRVETDGQVQLVRRDGSIVPACLYGPLHILGPGDCEVFEVNK